jgi:hypothetical protein
MEQVQRPTSIEFYQLYELVGKEVQVLATLRRPPPEEEPKLLGKTASEWTDLDDAGAFSVNLFRPSLLPEPKPKPSLPSEVARVEGALIGDTTLQWLRAQEPFRKLQESLKRKAKKEINSHFSKPVASYRLTQGVALCLWLHAHYLEGKRKPGQMSRKDWDAAIEAIQTLRKLGLEKGLRLHHAFRTWNGPAQLEARLVEARQTAKKPHDDGFTSDRATTRQFAEWLISMFGEVPPAMVEKFAELIGYNSDSIRKQLKAWEQAYRSDSLA